MRKSLPLAILVVLVVVVPMVCQAADIYITQNTSGGDTGADCSNAHSASWFNSNAKGGNIYHLCGTFTGAAGGTMLTVPGGSSGSLLTVLFEPGAVMTAPYWGAHAGPYATSGAISINGSYVTIDGGSNGIIQNTLNGAAGTSCPGGTCTDNVSAGIYVSSSATNLEIRNLTIKNIFLCNGAATCNSVYSTPIMIGPYSAANNVSIHDNTLSDGGVGLFLEFSGKAISNVNIYNNTTTNEFWGIAVAAGSAGNSTKSVNIYGNNISGCSTWAGTYNGGNGPHCDGVILYCTQGSSCPFNIYNNVISESGAVTADIYCTYSSGSGGSGSQCTMFNNVLYIDNYTGAGIGGGTAFWAGGSTGPHYLYNNTIVGSTNSPANYLLMLGNGNVQSMQNNLFTTNHYAVYNYSGSLSTYLASSDYNLYYNLNSSSFFNGSSGITYSAWQALGYDAHGVTGNPNLGSGYMLQSGSAAIGAGKNLTSLGIPSLNADAAGNARPATGAWDIGAFQYGSQNGSVNPPTGLSATVN